MDGSKLLRRKKRTLTSYSKVSKVDQNDTSLDFNSLQKVGISIMQVSQKCKSLIWCQKFRDDHVDTSYSKKFVFCQLKFSRCLITCSGVLVNNFFILLIMGWKCAKEPIHCFRIVLEFFLGIITSHKYYYFSFVDSPWPFYKSRSPYLRILELPKTMTGDYLRTFATLTISILKYWYRKFSDSAI